MRAKSLVTVPMMVLILVNGIVWAEPAAAQIPTSVPELPPIPQSSSLPPAPIPTPLPIPASQTAELRLRPAPAPSPLTTPYTVNTVNSPVSQSPPQMPTPEGNPNQSQPPRTTQQYYGDQPLFEVVDEPRFEPRWRLDLLLGAPSGFRVQRQLGVSQFWGEIGAGSYLWWPAVFAGIRSEGRLFSGRSDVFSIRPGVDVSFLQGYTYRDHRWDDGWYDSRRVLSAGMASLDFDLSWKHRWYNSLHSELALKLGAGVAINSREAFVLPVAGFAFGINY